MGSVGDCYGTALCESFFATLEVELLNRTSFRTHAQARLAVLEFIESWYNRRRRHQAHGYVSPAQFEATMCGSASPAGARDDRFRRTEALESWSDSSGGQTPTVQ